jgi:monoamine oxidase
MSDPSSERAPQRISRRRLIGTAGGVAAVGAATVAGFGNLSGVAEATATSGAPSDFAHVDVAIVGGGISGLAAARVLKSTGRSFVILEASDRTGGRVRNAPVGTGADQVTELGGEWVADGQVRVLALLKEYGIKTFPTYGGGSNLFYNGQQVFQYTGSVPSGIDATDEAALISALTALEGMASQVNLQAPQNTPNALEWDNQTFAQWVASNVTTPLAQTLVANSLGGALGPAPQQQSLLHFLFVAQSAGGPAALFSTKGVLQLRVVGGSGLLVERMTARLKGHVVLEAPVSSITQTANGVLLQTPKGVYSATRAIVAMAPPMTGRIAFYPKMPIARDQFAQHTPMGCAMKAFAVYPTPFWRQAGLSGMSTATTGPIVGTFDNTPPSGTPGVLYGLVDSNTYLQWGLRPEAERKAAILDMLGTFFGPQAKTPTKYFEFDWSAQPWIRGGATIGAVPGTWTSFGSAWRAPIGRIHWASTETSSTFNGDMDGAIRSGERAVGEIYP